MNLQPTNPNGTRQTRTDKAKELFTYGAFTESLKIFKTFKIGFTKDEHRTLEIAYESLTGNEKFYQAIGVDTAGMITQARTIIKEKYSL